LGYGTEESTCSRRTWHLLSNVDDAINAQVASQPALFDLGDEAGGTGSRQYRVLNTDAYTEGVLANLRAQGLCADVSVDNPELIRVKQSNEFNEDFAILLSSGHVRRGSGSYMQTCTPAAFPLASDPSGPPPEFAGCHHPYPPEITRFKVKVHLQRADYWVLDSTPWVGPNGAYCAAIGYTDGRLLCPVRVEGDPSRSVCEQWRVGTARDNGRRGPTWTRDGHYCTGPESGCDNTPDNQFQLWVYPGGGGLYTVCAENGACGELQVQH
jgi:hypothetical protein